MLEPVGAGAQFNGGAQVNGNTGRVSHLTACPVVTPHVSQEGVFS